MEEEKKTIQSLIKAVKWSISNDSFPVVFYIVKRAEGIIKKLEKGEEIYSWDLWAIELLGYYGIDLKDYAEVKNDISGT